MLGKFTSDLIYVYRITKSSVVVFLLYKEIIFSNNQKLCEELTNKV